MNAFYIAGLGMAVIDWIAVARSDRRLEYAAKPATMLVLIAGLLISGDILSSPLGWLFLAGLFFSLLGDIFLMLPANRFIPGLIAFLIAHLFYVFAFNQGGPVLTAASAAFAAVVVALAFLLLRQIRRSLFAAKRPRLWLPVAVYGVVLGTTLWSTLCTLLRPEWPWQSSLLAAAGGGLFFVSDAMNAWERFVRRFGASRLLVMISYHAAQYLMAAAIVLALAGLTP